MVIIVATLFMGFLAGFTARSYYIRGRTAKIQRIAIPNFDHDLLIKMTAGKDKEYILASYEKGDQNYVLKKELLKNDKLKIYSIFQKNGLLNLITPVEAASGHGAGGGYGGGDGGGYQ